MPRITLSRTLLLRAFAMSMMLPVWSLGLEPADAGARCQPRRFDVLTPGLASTPYIVLTAGGRTGPWLLDFGSTRTSIYAAAWKDAEPDPLFDFAALGIDGAPRRLPVVEGGQVRSGVGAPLGRIGTDVLKLTTTEFHFEDGPNPYVVFLDPSCGQVPAGHDADTRIDQTGFFSAHPEAHDTGLPNVPVVFLELEERSTDRARPRLTEPRRSPRTWAQVDTGYADTYWPYAVDINEPYLALLRASVPTLTLTGLVPVSGCGQEDTLREVYVAPGWRLAIVPDLPQRTIPFDSFHLIVKPRTTACGGIGPMPVPAAQLGASFLRAFGTTRFIPKAAEMQIRLPGRE